MHDLSLKNRATVSRHRMTIRFGRALATALVLTVLFGVPAITDAAPVTFAQYIQKEAFNDVAFRPIPGGSGKELVTTRPANGAPFPGDPISGTPIEFKYSNLGSMLPSALQGFQNAHLTVELIAAPDPSLATESPLSQPITSGIITMTRDTPFSGQDLLLRATIGGGEIMGGSGSFSATVQSSTGAGYPVLFESDFIADLPKATAESLALGLSSLIPILAVDTSNPLFLADFNAASVGTFSADLEGVTGGVIPEPSSIVLVSLAALGGIPMLIRRRRRRVRFLAS